MRLGRYCFWNVAADAVSRCRRRVVFSYNLLIEALPVTMGPRFGMFSLLSGQGHAELC